MNETLDPDDWPSLRSQGHIMLDDMFDYLEQIRQRPLWQPIGAELRAAFQQPLPVKPISLQQAHERFMTQVLPYGAGNSHPRFMAWVQGGGTPVGMLADMLAAGLNANVGGRDQMPLQVEQQIGLWMRELFAFPETSHGLFVTGSSAANLLAILVARTRALGADSRVQGLAAAQPQLIAYAGVSVHSCIGKAMEISGLGSAALHLVALDVHGRIDVAALQAAIASDRAAGLRPFLLVGTAGTVNIGALDPLQHLAAVAQREKLWFHVDGALAGLGMMAPDIAPKLAGIEQADSIALDFHKWGQVPYDAGFFLVRDAADQLASFATPAAYLTRHTRGLAAGSPWPCDFGTDLSRGFRALKTWFTFMCYGSAQLGRVMSRSCALAQYLKQRIQANPKLELMAPVALNIVCFRFVCADMERVNADLVVALHESGLAAPSASRIDGHAVIRAALVNHRSQRSDIDALLAATLAFGQQLAQHS